MCGQRLADVMPRCTSVTPAIAQYRNATTAASDLLSGRVVGVFGRNNECVEPVRANKCASMEVGSGHASRNCLGRGSSCGDLLAGLRLRRDFTEMMV